MRRARVPSLATATQLSLHQTCRNKRARACMHPLWLSTPASHTPITCAAPALLNSCLIAIHASCSTPQILSLAQVTRHVPTTPTAHHKSGCIYNHHSTLQHRATMMCPTSVRSASFARASTSSSLPRCALTHCFSHSNLGRGDGPLAGRPDWICICFLLALFARVRSIGRVSGQVRRGKQRRSR